MSCAVTGHRPGRFRFGYQESHEDCRRLKRRMLGIFAELYRRGVRRFYVGGALGVDMWAGELLVWLRRKPAYRELEIILALPFPGHDFCWREEDRQRLHRLMEQCSEVVVVSQENSRGSYFLRNRYMVDRADWLLAVYDNNSSSGGTRYTVDYARKKQIPILMLHPDTAELTQE